MESTSNDEHGGRACCPSCSNEISSTASYCPTCGTKLPSTGEPINQPEPIRTCRCGFVTQNNAFKCLECGATLPSGSNAHSKEGPRPSGAGDSSFSRLLAGVALLAVLIAAPVVFLYRSSNEQQPKNAANLAREAAEQAENRRKGFHCLSPIDGSQPDIVAQTKEKLTDPDSFEHIETRITPANKGGYHHLMMRFRSRNAFNGMVEGRAIGSVDTRTCNGYLITVE